MQEEKFRNLQPGTKVLWTGSRERHYGEVIENHEGIVYILWEDGMPMFVDCNSPLSRGAFIPYIRVWTPIEENGYDHSEGG